MIHHALITRWAIVFIPRQTHISASLGSGRTLTHLLLVSCLTKGESDPPTAWSTIEALEKGMKGRREKEQERKEEKHNKTKGKEGNKKINEEERRNREGRETQ